MAAGIELLFWMIFGGFILICWLLAEVCERKEKDLPKPHLRAKVLTGRDYWRVIAGRARTP